MSGAGPSQAARPPLGGGREATSGGPASADVSRANRALGRRLAIVVVAMFGFGFALVPLYETICEVTGIRDIAGPDAPANTQVDASRTIRVEFDTNVRNLPWQFKPREPVIEVHPGALTHATFEVVNTTARPVTGQAIPSFGPQYAGQYFRKLDCFCFAKQTLAPGERREMPVVFVIDPAAPRDLNAIALSYTFFEVEGADRVAPGPNVISQR